MSLAIELKEVQLSLGVVAYRVAEAVGSGGVIPTFGDLCTKVGL